MSERDLPEGTAPDEPLSFDDGVKGIDDLLGPAADPDEDEATNEADADEADESEGDEPEEEKAEDEDADAEDQDEDAEDEDDSEEDATEGKTAADDAEVELDDGTRITVAELKRNNLFQRDYTRKTTELAESRKAFEAQQQQVEHAAQTLAQHRDFLVAIYQQAQPQPPDPSIMDADPIGYMRAKDAYEQQMQVWHGLQQQQQFEAQRRQQTQTAQTREKLVAEQRQMLELEPRLKDPQFYQAFTSEAQEYVQAKGAPEGALSMLDAAWQFDILRDAMEYRKIKAKAPAVRKDLEKKPKILRGSKRQDPKAQKSQGQQARAEKLRKTGDLDAGIEALMDLDL